MFIDRFSNGTEKYRLISKDGVKRVSMEGRIFYALDPLAIIKLASEAFHDAAFYLRSSHLEGWKNIIEDPEASDNDRYVAAALLKNAVISASGELPLCQDTGTATVVALRGSNIITDGTDESAISDGIKSAYSTYNLRYSQIIPDSMTDEHNSKNNLPGQVEIIHDSGDSYRFLFIAKGGGSSNKTTLIQASKALLREDALKNLLGEKISSLGVAACPPYHLAVVIGGTSPEANLKTLKLATAHACDHISSKPSENGVFRDQKWEEIVMEIAQESGLGAQFGGKYLAMDARVIRLPRHAGSCPVSIGVSCSAHRNILGRIDADGVWLEELETEPEKYLLQVENSFTPVEIEITDDIEKTAGKLDGLAAGSLVHLSGTMIVARDIAHARLFEMLKAGNPLPDYFKRYPVYYAGPAKTPAGMPIGSFGPTTAQRMDEYLETFMSLGFSRITLAKGNRSPSVAKSCARYNGFYLGTIGGAASLLAKENIVHSEIIDFEDLGMEAIRKIQVKNLPAFIITDNRGNSLY
ncbi:FumA C-terminus/TtdB family hydratase beta subunit [Myxococcota bacterium]|nr:FumA C-terminus/TtdB family hydratase beta subunit [Myxococcota bacterium]MBU1382648.1 FumA C-terminus/TtdB family hydratase beta subunit [Myxococcota bacterium]MBU1497260.1 FumA C-terminus/TtdB family hydratase beta subunit [Myxococcota bacterium]